MTATGETDRLEAVRRRLRDDYVFYPERALWIVDKQGTRRRFMLKRPQRRLNRALMAQRDAGMPQRAVALKARQVGVSTDVQGLTVQRATQHENHLAMVLAQDRQTAGALFKIGDYMWANLPADIKPPRSQNADTQDRKYSVFGEPSMALRRQGLMGLNSRIEIATPKGLSARGRTPRTLHISEYAFWTVDEALIGILNGVPDDPGTLVVIESTAKGHNHFKDDWDLAVSGESGYYPFFSPWFEEEEYRRPMNDADAATLERGLGRHPRWGADEPQLADTIREEYVKWAGEDNEPAPDEAWLERRVLEHLAWRRWAIPAKCRGSVDKFKQEYPSVPDEAFLATGSRVYDVQSISMVIKRCGQTDPPVPSLEVMGPVPGGFRVDESRSAVNRQKQRIEVPTSVVWVPQARLDRDEQGGWRLWQAPRKERRLEGEDGGEPRIVPAGQYVIGGDPASGETDDKGVTHAEHALQVIDHESRLQVAEWTGQMDPDLWAMEALKAALFFNRAWVVIERTGGYGLAALRLLSLDWHYPYVFTEQSKDKRSEKRSDRLGISTDHVSKPLMEAHLMELLRLEKDGIQSMRVARQMLTYVRRDNGSSGPESGALADALMALTIAQYGAHLRPLRPGGAPQSGKKKKGRRDRPRSRKTGY
jgi:hypothetical protein